MDNVVDRANSRNMREALCYQRLGENRVLCTLCNHLCKIKDGNRGACGARSNHNGKLYTFVYDRVVARGKFAFCLVLSPLA